jgi:hypothetical protein
MAASPQHVAQRCDSFGVVHGVSAGALGAQAENVKRTA